MSFHDRSWMGGINYYANLMHALLSLPNRRIEPVILTSPGTPEEILTGLPSIEILRTPLVDRLSRLQYLRRVPYRLIGRDLLMETWSRCHGLELLSHSDSLGARASVPTLGWIPDFQQFRHPEFFSSTDSAIRIRRHRRFCEACQGIVLSSYDAQKHLADFAPAAVAKSAVLHFVSGLGGEANNRTLEGDLHERYNLRAPYFHLPNQFWAHKNHRVVIDALAILKARGHTPLVIATGHTADSRQPGYFTELMRHVETLGVGDTFRVLGLVPYADLTALMRNAAAVINPSLFEGWSTSVEESKSLGKTVLLSDIAVHREQAPEHGKFFDPRDAPALAQAMADTLRDYSLDSDLNRRAQAQRGLPARMRAFGAQYEEIALNVMNRRR
jgi:glycosyltransferase involved in cell wall biosynthesis